MALSKSDLCYNIFNVGNGENMKETKIETKTNNNNRKKLITNSIYIVAFLILAVLITIYISPVINNLATDQGRENLRLLVKENWVNAFLMLLGLQVAQIVIAFIPGYFIDVAAGMMFGQFWGIVLLSIGSTIATVIVYYLGKWLGTPFIRLFVTKNFQEKYGFLKKTKRTEVIFFFIFLLPGVPKDVFIYLAPLTNINLFRFIVITLIARIPGWILELAVGKSFMDGDFLSTIVIIIIIVLIAVIGIIFRKEITQFLEKRAFRSSKIDHTDDKESE